MMKEQQDFYDNMSDNEIRVIGADSQPASSVEDSAGTPVWQNTDPESASHKGWFKWWYVLLVAVLAVGVAVIVAVLPAKVEPSDNQGTVEAESYETVAMDTLVAETDTHAYCEERLDSVNDIVLRIVTPVGCLPQLHLGKLPDDAHAFVMVAQAADVRGDNGKIAGAYVYRGELMSKGMSKLGFCAIIGNEITLGRQSETPLFERAIENNGYFFRQYSLVNEGRMIDIKPKGKALRRALCYHQGKIVIIESTERESYHDFSQALADLGVEEALALVGGDALFCYTDADGEQHSVGTNHEKEYENVNFIVWK